MHRAILWGLLPALVFTGPLPAQSNEELLKKMQAMEARIQALEAEVRQLKGQGASPAAPEVSAAPAMPAPAPPPLPVEPSAPPPTLGGAGGAAAKVLNPDISVIGDFTGAVGNSRGRNTPSLQMHESEVGFQEVIDPYARADFFFSFGEQGVDLEEGYLTFTALPAGLQLKVGKMRSLFGKVNTLHNHALPWVDRPLVTEDLLAGEEGLNDAGLSLSRILPAPKGIFLEGTTQLYRGDSEGVFEAAKRSDLSTVNHLRLYKDLSESTNLELGGSFARGRSPFASGWNQLYGIDTTLRWKPLRRAIYHSFIGRSELVWARTRVTPGLTAPLGSPALVTPFGYFVSGEYQLGRRWFLGARFDRSQRGACLPTFPETAQPCDPSLPGAGLLRDTGGSLLLTYWPSEFSQIRGQLRRTQYGAGPSANEILFQFLFSMGAHGAHPF